MARTIVMSSLSTPRGVRRFVRSIRLNEEFIDDTWIVRCDELNLWGYARDRCRAWRELGESFEHAWSSFVLCDASVLHPSAAALRALLIGLVGRA